jgi:hypothetical protein
VARDLEQFLAREVARPPALRVAGWPLLDMSDSVHQLKHPSIRSGDQIGTSSPEIVDHFADLRHRG